jgi:hypothetical protein
VLDFVPTQSCTIWPAIVMVPVASVGQVPLTGGILGPAPLVITIAPLLLPEPLEVPELPELFPPELLLLVLVDWVPPLVPGEPPLPELPPVLLKPELPPAPDDEPPLLLSDPPEPERLEPPKPPPGLVAVWPQPSTMAIPVGTPISVHVDFILPYPVHDRNVPTAPSGLQRCTALVSVQRP